jgi:hypothetical protein
MGQIYRFIGTTAEVGPLKFERVGQRVEMEDFVADNARIGGCALLTEAQFNSFGFTSEDLKIWTDPFIDPFDTPTVDSQAANKAAYMDRLGRAREMFFGIRTELVAARRMKETQRLVQEEANGEMPVVELEVDKE